MDFKFDLHQPEEFSDLPALVNGKSSVVLEDQNLSKTNLPHKNSDHLYLEKLKFNPELRKSWLNFFITRFRVVIMLIVVLTMLGAYSFISLPRESNPEVKIPIAVVMTTYPGASPADIEELVTKKVETGISGLKNVKKITSNSSNSVSAVTVEFDAKANLEDSIRKLRDAVNNLKKDLPADSNDPLVQEISFDDTPIWTISLTGPYDGFTLRQSASDIKDELEKIPGVREVNISGGDEKELEIAYDPQKLAIFGISADTANSAVKGANLAIPAGNFETDKFSYPIRVDGRFFDAEKLANIPLAHSEDGAIVFLKDVATVQEKAIEKTVYSRASVKGSAPQEDVTIQVVKKTGGSIIDTVAAANKATQDTIKKLPGGLHYEVSVDYAEIIDKNFKQLTHDFILTLILVFAVLFLIVGLKEALVAGLAIPLVFFATFGVMLGTGISLNFLSVFSLILALGLLVDDAIVVVSATKQYLRTGNFTPEEAVLLVLNDFKVVLTTTTLTTVWAFLPLLMASGIIGEFIKSIPITVSVTLISSLIIALIINHPLAAVLERVRLTKKTFSFSLLAFVALPFAWLLLPNKIIGAILSLLFLLPLFILIRWYRRGGKERLERNSELVEAEWADDELIKKKLREQGSYHQGFFDRLMHGIVNFNAVLPYYEKYLRRLLATKRSRLKTLAFATMLFLAAIALPVFGIVKSEFFPSSDFDYLYVNMEAPVGLKLAESDKITKVVEERLLKYPEIANFTTIVGASASASRMSGGSSSSHLSSVSVKLVPKEERHIKSYDLAEKIRADLSDIQDAKITVESPKGGPPSGAAFEARISGDDLQVLDKVASDLKPMLSAIPGVINPSISLRESPADYTFELDPARLELYSLNAAYVGSTLRLAISGVEATTVLRDGKEIKVMARFAKDKIPSLEAIQNLQILNLRKQPVFLRDVAKIELKPSVETITRIDQKRVVILSAATDGKANSADILAAFQKSAKNYQMPAGYEIFYGGENEQNTESVVSILQAMVVAILLIVITLIIQFNSIKKAFIVLVTIPLALIGVFFGLAIARINLSFPGLIGILALFGIVVKNAIILVDKISLNLKSDIPFVEAIVDAGKSRLEAIFITSICTILGIIPITLSDETWRALGGSVIFGLMLSSFLTLFIVPTLFMVLVKNKKRNY
ncbi:MAG: efflux RND transporter permease subunit [Candidatus Falkowbacteria bacterium]|nr:efflux RND transporter permease subunit [Candidatus Falkowbacteria bacterium]